jgi:hypothetical protein
MHRSIPAADDFELDRHLIKKMASPDKFRITFEDFDFAHTVLSMLRGFAAFLYLCFDARKPLNRLLSSLCLSRNTLMDTGADNSH